MKEKIKIKIKRLFQILGVLIMIIGVIFLLTHSFIVTGRQGEDFARDLFGFPIPHPPVWTSFIPFVGSLLGFIFEWFSIHGLIGISIFGVLLYIAGIFMTLGDNKKDKIGK